MPKDPALEPNAPERWGANGALGGITAAARFVALGAALITLAVWVVSTRPYTPGSDLGYWLGVAGGSMMLALLTYPLRKHLRKLAEWGPLRLWFRMHMVFGIGGPLLIVFHSGFRPGALNSQVALYSMLLVVASGLVGRYVYKRIHQGLYGRKASLRDREGQLSDRAAAVQAVLTASPHIRGWLDAYREAALVPHAQARAGVLARTRKFVSVPIEGTWLRIRVRAETGRALRAMARSRQWTGRRFSYELRLARRQVGEYIDSIDAVARFSAWERLFALWHVAHSPLVYLLLVSAIAHVVAVHMY